MFRGDCVYVYVCVTMHVFSECVNVFLGDCVICASVDVSMAVCDLNMNLCVR